MKNWQLPYWTRKSKTILFQLWHGLCRSSAVCVNHGMLNALISNLLIYYSKLKPKAKNFRIFLNSCGKLHSKFNMNFTLQETCEDLWSNSMQLWRNLSHFERRPVPSSRISILTWLGLIHWIIHDKGHLKTINMFL